MPEYEFTILEFTVGPECTLYQCILIDQGRLVFPVENFEAGGELGKHVQEEDRILLLSSRWFPQGYVI